MYLCEWWPCLAGPPFDYPLLLDRYIERAGQQPWVIPILRGEVQPLDVGLDQEGVLGVRADDLALILNDQLLRLRVEIRALGRVELDVGLLSQLVDLGVLVAGVLGEARAGMPVDA